MIKINGHPIKSFVFPAGEVQVKLPMDHIKGAKLLRIDARISSSDDFMSLLLVASAIHHHHQRFFDIDLETHLVIHYLPYARQDRVCSNGEAFSLDMVLDLLLRNFDIIEVTDIHNPKIIENDERIWHNDVLGILLQNKKWFEGIDLLVAPDKGSINKVTQISGAFEIPMVHADKVRNPEDGKITSYELHGDVKGKNVLVIDDICDGGGTFIMLADELKKKEAKSWNLYVTHGIFSRGLEPLYVAGYDKIYTTDSFFGNREEHPYADIIYGGNKLFVHKLD